MDAKKEPGHLAYCPRCQGSVVADFAGGYYCLSCRDEWPENVLDFDREEG